MYTHENYQNYRLSRRILSVPLNLPTKTGTSCAYDRSKKFQVPSDNIIEYARDAVTYGRVATQTRASSVYTEYCPPQIYEPRTWRPSKCKVEI